ncbi:beta-defensin 121 isoform X2 [Canis lupus baileyi]|uniref:beta-defensin 121 isoform X2 n=1 Tax=Canis lupus familiaris TaxID=9615 RepID=UPI000BAA2E98|nr:beta-defensin 121 isoform X2 [Canis lupus familiaris]XP_025325412.1 beta-defensin 121 isoform X2 [Canis lupus dingo]XP_038289342.1 beta-defensin 121 isoform X2 [Canis lupus familiaris]XP_038427836.1 beta-defensin 121 isoform X2 [Canis lupus familiaris]|eukprot:XP_003433288.2 beta-defensin 121 isoform X2 [Canis lupus familiaris]
MKLILLMLAVALLLVQVTQAMSCWGKLGRCRATCEKNEVFHILCTNEAKCCVHPKHVPIGAGSSSAPESLGH